MKKLKLLNAFLKKNKIKLEPHIQIVYVGFLSKLFLKTLGKFIKVKIIKDIKIK